MTIPQFGLPQDAIQFIAVFSRFEFALKRGGFCSGKKGAVAEANWSGFASQLGKRFFPAMEGNRETEEIILHPPGKHVRQADGSARFEHQRQPHNTSTLFEAVCLVRNNLFHGEKRDMNDRDLRLINGALFILAAALDACDGRNERLHAVRKHF